MVNRSKGTICFTLLILSFFPCNHGFGQWESLYGGTNHFVRSFRIDPSTDRLLVGGSFPFVQGGALRANSLAWWDGQEWSVEDLSNGNGDTSEFGVRNPVLSVAMRSDTIFAGHLSAWWHTDSTMGYAAMLADGIWQPCGDPNGIFYFLEEEGRLFSGGVHDSLYGAYAPGIHEWRNGAFVDIPGMPFISRVAVYGVEYWHDQYYFGGTFDALESPRIVAFDGVNQWTPVGGGVGGWFIETLCGYGDSLYVGGWFPEGPNVQSSHIQLWDGTNWKPFFPEVDFVDAVRDIQVHNGVLYICGVHKWIDDDTYYGLLRFDGTSLCSLGGPREGGSSKFAIYQNAIHLASNYTVGFEDEFVARLPLDGLVPDRCSEVINSVPSHGIGQVRVFPSPAADIVQVRTLPEMVGALLSVVDQLGREVIPATRVDSTHETLQVDDLATGAYTVVVTGNTGRYTARFQKE